MFSLLFSYLKHQSLRYKIVLALIIFLLLIVGYKSAQYSLLKYRILKEKAQQVEIYKDSLKVVKTRIKTLLNTGVNYNQKSQAKTKKIDQKLKEDEKSINNASVTDDELNDFLSNYEQRARENKSK